MGRPWTDDTEPRLAEVLDDPIVQKQMASDGISQDDLYRNIETVRKALLTWKDQADDPAPPHKH